MTLILELDKLVEDGNVNMAISRTNIKNQITKAPSSKKKVTKTKSGITITRIKRINNGYKWNNYI